MVSPIWGEGNGRGISGFAVNRGAVYRGFTVFVVGLVRWFVLFGNSVVL